MGQRGVTIDICRKCKQYLGKWNEIQLCLKKMHKMNMHNTKIVKYKPWLIYETTMLVA